MAKTKELTVCCVCCTGPEVRPEVSGDETGVMDAVDEIDEGDTIRLILNVLEQPQSASCEKTSKVDPETLSAVNLITSNYKTLFDV